MTTAPFEPSHNDPGLRPDTEPDGAPVTTPGLDAPAGTPDDPAATPDPTEPEPTES